jgi:hypothetical protein
MVKPLKIFWLVDIHSKKLLSIAVLVCNRIPELLTPVKLHVNTHGLNYPCPPSLLYSLKYCIFAWGQPQTLIPPIDLGLQMHTTTPIFILKI